VPYALSVHVSAADVLTVEIEEAESLARWRGQFSAKCGLGAARTRARGRA
jgi:hypothetical protein